MNPRDPILRMRNVAKSFTMHLRGGAQLHVVRDVTFDLGHGECVVLGGPSGAGKSSILKMIYGNYRVDKGEIWLRHGMDWTDLAVAAPRNMLRFRTTTIGYVSQFLRVIPRISAIDLIAAAAREGGLSEKEAQARSQYLLNRLNLPERLWGLPPATFSGGEQQRVNVARGFAANHPLLLLDEPTASLDSKSRDRVVELIAERRREGGAILGIFHDNAVSAEIADRVVDVTRFAPN